MKADRVPELDLLRFLAAVAVVLFHNVKLLGDASPASFMSATRFGHMGVQLFFLISGFVIVWTAAGKSAYPFVASRVARLYPSFWLSIAITCALLALGSQIPSFVTLLCNLTMLPSYFHAPYIDGVFWTLAIEMQFYALILALIVTRQMQRIELWLGAWLAAVLALKIAGMSADFITLRGFAPYFASGAYLYLIRNQGISASRVAALATSAALSVHQAVTHHAGATHMQGAAADWTAACLVLMMYSVFFLIAIRRLRIPASPVWYVLGCLTYPLYLLHHEFGREVFRLLPDSLSVWSRWTLMTLIVFAASAVLARWIERGTCNAAGKVLIRLGTRNSKPSVARSAGAVGSPRAIQP